MGSVHERIYCAVEPVLDNYPSGQSKVVGGDGMVAEEKSFYCVSSSWQGLVVRNEG